LEDFLANGMDKMVPPECQSPSPVVASNLVYFVQVRRSLEHALSARCRSLSNQSAFQQYNTLAEFFNQRLAGKFPFSPPSVDPAATEADPADVVEFYRRFDLDAKSIHQSLQVSGATFNSMIAIFLNQIDSLRPLFAPILTGQPGTALAFDLVPVFRVNRNHEINGNQIIDWNLQVGENVFRKFDQPAKGHWTYNEPIKIILRWAKDSPQQPVPIPPSTANATTRTVIFEYHDPWSLLRMLVQNAAASADLDRGIDTDPQTLVFTASQKNSSGNAKGQPVPPDSKDANPDQAAKVFIRLRIYATGKTEALRITAFPIHAPTP
jgi:type VI secretion system protein ImpL